jgi:broad specificity phosphatase PhoE
MLLWVWYRHSLEPASGSRGFFKMIVYLVRHGETNVTNNGLYGRNPGVHLSAAGKTQALKIADHLQDRAIDAIYSSPLERAMQTAEPLASRKNIPIHTSAALNEVDQGEWTGQSWSELREDPSWRLYNTFRSGTGCPNGEMAVEVQARIARELNRLLGVEEDQHIAIFTHADVVRAAVCFYVGISLDLSLRVEIGLGSVSTLELRRDGARIIELNRIP